MQIQFNGWGEKQVHTKDAQIASKVADRLGLPLIPTGLVGEGGSVDHDGEDYIIAHESSWKNDNRNPGMSLQEIEDRLLDAYGASKIVWGRGVWDLDITDYHIDSLARFTAPRRILINLPEEPDFHDPFHQAALDTYDILKRAGLEVEVIPEPNKRRVNSYDFVASYANYYVCNGSVIASQFGDERTDEIAVNALKKTDQSRWRGLSERRDGKPLLRQSAGNSCTWTGWLCRWPRSCWLPASTRLSRGLCSNCATGVSTLSMCPTGRPRTWA